jgi:phospholipid N-methyltransferase
MVRIKKLRPQPDARLDFLRGFLRDPQQVGSVIPSSRFLERRVMALAGVRSSRLVVELGPGTGGTTRAVLRELPRNATLVCIEIDPRFTELLRRNTDPRLVIHQGSAADLGEILAQHGLAGVDAVISGIPFSTMDRDLGRRIVEQIHDVLRPGGRFVAYQVRGRVGELGRAAFGTPETLREFRNIPPMRIYRWRKQAPAAAVERLGSFRAAQ